MKRLSFVALLLLAVFMTSCDGLGGGDAANIDKSQIVGKWMTADGQYFEVYNSDGTGKEWDLRDDVTEEEASKFTWEFDEGAEDKCGGERKADANAVETERCAEYTVWGECL